MLLSIYIRTVQLLPERNIFRAIDRAYQISLYDRTVASMWISYRICNCIEIFFALSANGIL